MFESKERAGDSLAASALMEGVSYEIETQSQFWAELDEILDPVGTPPAQIDVDAAVRSFVRFSAAFRSIHLTHFLALFC